MATHRTNHDDEICVTALCDYLSVEQATHPVLTIGHSSRPLSEFLSLLTESKAQCVVDVRRLPGSRAFPQYNSEPLADSLDTLSMKYWHLEALCGRRTTKDLNGIEPAHFWTNASFARYAAYAKTPAFEEGLGALVARASVERCVLMCSEAVWWRCHRRIIADHLLAQEHKVFHIMGIGKVVPASLTKGAAVCDGQVVYPAHSAND